MTNIISNITSLQTKGILPTGQYEYTNWERPFSFIFRVSVGRHVFFFKKLKPRVGFSKRHLVDKLYGEYRALTKVAGFFSEHECFSVPIPVHYSLEDLLLITKELKGTSILDVGKDHAYRRKTSDLSALEIYIRAGKFLRVLHDSETYPYTTQDLDDLVNYIRERLFSGIFNKVEEARLYDYLTRTHTAIKDNIKSYNKCHIHHDFGPGNILFHGNDINVLDFGDYRIDHHFQDLGYFKLMLERQLESRIKYRQSAKGELIRAFSKGYGCEYKTISKDKLYNLFLLKNLAIFIKTLAFQKELKQPFQLSIISLKKKIQNSMGYHRIKRKILLIAEG